MTRHAQSALEYLLVLAGAIMLVALVAFAVQNLMTQPVNTTNSIGIPPLWK